MRQGWQLQIIPDKKQVSGGESQRVSPTAAAKSEGPLMCRAPVALCHLPSYCQGWFHITEPKASLLLYCLILGVREAVIFSPKFLTLKLDRKYLSFCKENCHKLYIFWIVFSAPTWCTGKTQRDRVEREVGGGIGMGNTCKSKADSCQCMTKTTTVL